MSNIKYTDKQGEHKGTLTPAEYYIYGYGMDLEPDECIIMFNWLDTEYSIFKKAIGAKYNTLVTDALITN